MVLSGHETHPKQLTDTCTLRSVAILSALRSQAASSDHVHLLQAPERRSDARTKHGAMLMSRAALAGGSPRFPTFPLDLRARRIIMTMPADSDLRGGTQLPRIAAQGTRALTEPHRPHCSALDGHPKGMLGIGGGARRGHQSVNLEGMTRMA